MHVESSLGEGTMFELFLPLHEGVVAAPTGRTDVRPGAEGTETILLVEDEPGLRALARRILERQGYVVLASANGREGLETARAHGMPLHLVLTDVVMPEMNGRAMVEHLRTERPDVAVVYMSGYSPHTAGRELPTEPLSRFLQKPVLPQTMLQTVRECLDQKAQ